jgi:hypothetical protein
MTNTPVTGSNTEQKPANPASPATPQQQNQGTPKPADSKPSEQQK